LTVIAIIPQVMMGYLRIPSQVATFFGGTSILILVGVVLDTMRQMETHLLMRHYDGFLKKGRLKGRF
jgi:preprotein translocase subunit SecY